MARQPRQAAIDAICREWGKVRRQLRGLSEPERARDILGAIRSTLGERRDLHSGARSNRLEQHWPEVYEGDSAVVNQAFHAMPPRLKVMMEVHFVAHGPVSEKADLLAMSRDKYFEEVRDVRQFVEGWVARDQVAI